MKLEDLKKLKIELKEECKQNEENYNKLDKKMYDLQFKNIRFPGPTFVFCLFVLIMIIGATPGAIVGMFSTEVFTCLSMVVSVLVGVGIKKGIEKILISKGIFNDLPNITNQKQVLEELTKNSIEMEFYLQKFKMLEFMHNKIESKEKSLNDVMQMDEYILKEKDNNVSSSEVICKVVENLRSDLQQKEQELHKLITKYVLKRELYDSKKNDLFLGETIKNIGLGGCGLTFIAVFPLITRISYGLPIEINFLFYLATFVVGGVGMTTFEAIKNKDKEEIFEKIRIDLCNGEKIDIDMIEYVEMLENILKDMYELRMDLEEEKAKLESVKREEKNTDGADYSYNRTFAMDKELEMIDLDLEEKYVGGTRIRKRVKDDVNN